mmetsp:Transcript_74086/g.226624  ORF Transcript_74086/g.226624 Transcript_74086/m.226624 type:complete len:245 (+) Transcript_74086:517-1251(+)
MVPKVSSWTHCWLECPALQASKATVLSWSMPSEAVKHLPHRRLVTVLSTTAVVVLVVLVLASSAGAGVLVSGEAAEALTGASLGGAVGSSGASSTGAVQFLNGGTPQKPHSGFWPSAKQPIPPMKQKGSHWKGMCGLLPNWHSPCNRPLGVVRSTTGVGSSTLASTIATLPWIMHELVSSSCTVSACPPVPSGLKNKRGSLLVRLQLVPFMTVKVKLSSSPKCSATSRSENSTTTSPTHVAATE